MAHLSELAPLLPFHNDATPVTDSRRPRGEQLHDALRRSGAPVLSFRLKHTHPEPEDARITGMTRSLDRRLLALNLRKPAISISSEALPSALIA
jgi:hypothetical protein